MVLQASRFHALGAIAAFVAVGSSSSSSSSSMFASAALELTVTDCSDFAALPMDAMTEDVTLFLDDATTFKCDKVSNAVPCVFPIEYMQQFPLIVEYVRWCDSSVEPALCSMYSYSYQVYTTIILTVCLYSGT